ncbi:MAG: molybdopterin molybdotransferase MoeA [Planctomycetota bacterium]
MRGVSELMEPDAAVGAMRARVGAERVKGATERLALAYAVGRVLADDLYPDRDSPPFDASAMDGYAVRLAEVRGLVEGQTLPVSGEVKMGQAPPAMPEGHAVRVFTGGAVPGEADAVIKREDLDESADVIGLRVPASSFKEGQNIRRRGENASGSEPFLKAGMSITLAGASACAAFGIETVEVCRRVRVVGLVTGDELVRTAREPGAYELRDSNGRTLAAAFSALPWCECVAVRHCGDQRAAIAAAVGEALQEADAVVLTGGVSKGDHDHVPGAVRDAMGDAGVVVYHGLKMRPGKPNFGAVNGGAGGGSPVFGLPGNPVSVLVGLRLLVMPVLQKVAGFSEAAFGQPASVVLDDPDGKDLHLNWYRTVRRTGTGRARLMTGKGSGDLVHTAGSDGFVHVPPGVATGDQPLPFYGWTM